MTNNSNKYEEDPFGLYRAEWLEKDIFRLFAQPAYYPELETTRPCVLVGGRGTGKTTVLRCLSYQGQYSLHNKDRNFICNSRYIGLYHRVNTNRTNAFIGPELDDLSWRKIFSHYINIILSIEILSFLIWYRDNIDVKYFLTESECQQISYSLNSDPCVNVNELHLACKKSQKKIENFLNGNLSKENMPNTSLLGSPVEELCEFILNKNIFPNTKFFFIFDEYENFIDYQQKILNTLIKHSGNSYTFKIGVKELGWREKSIISQDEFLKSPADYELLDISQKLSGKKFSSFAEEVCNKRAQSNEKNFSIIWHLGNFNINSLVLFNGGNKILQEAFIHLKRESIEESVYRSFTDFEVICWYIISKSEKKTMFKFYKDIFSDKEKKDKIISNYAPSILSYTCNESGTCSDIYYGWNNFIFLAHSNIRYLLELVSNARSRHITNHGNIRDGIDKLTQSQAAIWVSEKNLKEIEGVSIFGAPLRKLIIGLGKIFSEISSKPIIYGQPVSRFHLASHPNSNFTCEILRHGIMHLALVRLQKNNEFGTDINDYNYSIHPIFYPFLGMPVGIGRSICLSENDIRELSINPTQTSLLIIKNYENYSFV